VTFHSLKTPSIVFYNAKQGFILLLDPDVELPFFLLAIYTDTNQTNILKFVYSHFTTTRQLIISYDSLFNKYYQIDEGTKRKVIDHLMEMAQRCKKM